MDDFRRLFIRGLAALVPTLLTIAILAWAYRLVNDYIGVYVTEGLVLVCSILRAAPAPGLVNENIDPIIYGEPIDEWNDRVERLTIEHKVIHHKALHDQNEDVRKRALENRNEALWHLAFTKYRLHLLGFLIAIILVYFVGFFLASFIGRAIWRTAEGTLYRIPLIRAIYPHIKQVTDFLLSERTSLRASGVVAVEYPRKGIWSFGLSIGAAMGAMQKASADDLLTIFVPCSPTPVTGYVIHIPRKEVVELDVSIDQAVRFLVSCGVIKPESPLAPMVKAKNG